jgi:multimeric flavodoxin WrbA
MPKTLILFHGAGGDVATMAEAVAEGVRSVRFAEVDVRRLGEPAGSASGGTRQTLTRADELAAYDGLVLGTAAGDAMPEAVAKLLREAEALRQRGSLGLLVGAAFVAGATDDSLRWSLLRALGGLGLVLVPTGGAGPDEGRKQGHRVAHVVSWITHARSHHH